MSKIFLVLFILLVFSYFNTGKAQKSEDRTNSTENIKSEDDEDESASIQVVQRDVETDNQNKTNQDEPLIKHEDNQHKVENHTEVLEDTNSTKAEDKYDAFFEDLISDSAEIPLENRDHNIEEVSGVVSLEEINENTNQDTTFAFDDMTTAYNRDEKSQEDSATIIGEEEDENNWRSAEHLNSDEKKNLNEATHEASVEDDKDYSAEDYMDKKIESEVKGRMDTRLPERRQLFNTRPDVHSFIDSGPMRSFGEMVVPHYRPVLTRSGIVYTPNVFAMQTGPSLLDRLSGRNWVPNRVHMNPEAEALKPRHHRIISSPQYEDTKVIDDYSDYGPNSNTYSYTPVKKSTTQAPSPQQIAAPNKFDIFQKLVEASNHPKSQKRTFNDFPGHYHPQRQYPDSLGSYNVRRVRRNAWAEPPFQDI